MYDMCINILCTYCLCLICIPSTILYFVCISYNIYIYIYIYIYFMHIIFTICIPSTNIVHISSTYNMHTILYWLLWYTYLIWMIMYIQYKFVCLFVCIQILHDVDIISVGNG